MSRYAFHRFEDNSTFHFLFPSLCVSAHQTDDAARAYYEHEVLRGGWSVRSLDRQIATKAFNGSVESPATRLLSSSPAGLNAPS
jgi:hypothetical protein